MNNLISDFRGFDGRINRQRWWIGVVVLIIVGIIVEYILGAIFGTGMMVNPASITDPSEVAGLIQRTGWVGLVTGIILAYPYLAITVKRRHDRNNNGYDAIAVIVVSILLNLLTGVGITASVAVLGVVVGLILLVLAIYVLVQVGFLKGTVGANQYGPDPLGG